MREATRTLGGTCTRLALGDYELGDNAAHQIGALILGG